MFLLSDISSEALDQMERILPAQSKSADDELHLRSELRMRKKSCHGDKLNVTEVVQAPWRHINVFVAQTNFTVSISLQTCLMIFS